MDQTRDGRSVRSRRMSWSIPCYVLLLMIGISDGFIITVRETGKEFTLRWLGVAHNNALTKVDSICEPSSTSSISLSASTTSGDHFLQHVDKLFDDLSSDASFDRHKWMKTIFAEIHDDFERDLLRFQWLLPSPTLDQNNEDRDSTGRIQQIESEWIHVPEIDNNNLDSDDNSRRLALRTSTPVLDSSTIDLLRSVADEYWKNQDDAPSSSSSSSLFTYQRRGNMEAHLGDLCSYNCTLKDAIQSALELRVFPLVQKEFMEQRNSDKIFEWKLHIYDSLFIRYNATAIGAATQSTNNQNCDEVLRKKRKFIGAGQPLHRDLGVVSVNIMLNEATEFAGGGTFFEDQLFQTRIDDRREKDSAGTGSSLQFDCCDQRDFVKTRLPVKPSRKRGRALLHYSNLRHAGAGTTWGVRDILVMFLSASRTHGSSSSGSNIHPIELGARIKEKSKTIQFHNEATAETASPILEFHLKRALLYHAAANSVASDGEAYHYLGTCLDALAAYASDQKKGQLARRLAVEALQKASSFIPNDGRLFNNQGLILGKQQPTDDMQVEYCFKRSIDLHLQCQAVGCDVETDLESAALNYGLFLANRDRWEDAIQVLDLIDFFGPCNDDELTRVRGDAFRLREFSAKKCNGISKSTLVLPPANAIYEKVKRWVGDK